MTQTRITKEFPERNRGGNVKGERGKHEKRRGLLPLLDKNPDQKKRVGRTIKAGCLVLFDYINLAGVCLSIGPGRHVGRESAPKRFQQIRLPALVFFAEHGNVKGIEFHW